MPTSREDNNDSSEDILQVSDNEEATDQRGAGTRNIVQPAIGFGNTIRNLNA